MKEMETQIKRIEAMEGRFDEAVAAVKELSAALDRYEAAQDDIAALKEYYGSKAWKKDYADDESERLPEGLKRGVLSEDGLWNLLSEEGELKERLKEI